MFYTSSVRKVRIVFVKILFRINEKQDFLTSLQDHIPTKDEQIHPNDEDQV
jgi:hypothetical protein